MIRKSVSVLCLVVTTALAGPVSAQAVTTTASTVKPLDFTSRCPGGGTRAATGTWDSSSGKLGMSVKVSNCRWDNDELHSGTRTVDGTLLVGSQRDIKIDMTIKEDFTVTRDGATRLTHVCTVTKKGTLDDAGDRFTGTITQNCTNSGELWDPDHWVENLMRHTLAIEVPKQAHGKMPPARGPGNACGKFKTKQGNGKDKDSGATGTTGSTTGPTGTSTSTTGMAETHEEGDICGDD